MIPRPFDEVSKQDIDDLVAEARPERRTLEYKQALPNLAMEQDKYEFLADVASFANASGGDILFGVVDKREAGKPTGIPESAPGVSVPNADAVIRQLEQTARSHIDPKVPGLQMRAIPGFPNGHVVLARVPKSYAGPHMVRNDKAWGRFYARGSAGKHILDIGEIRSAFALAESLPQRIRDFRAGRVAAVAADEGPVHLGPGPLFVLHVLPIRALDPLDRLDVTPTCPWTVLRPPTSQHAGVDMRHNFDGVLYHAFAPGRETVAYTQLFRNGAVEAVDSIILRLSGPNCIDARRLEDTVIESLRQYLAALKGWGVGTPLFVMLTLLGVRGAIIPHERHKQAPVDRDSLALPDVLIEDYAVDAAAKLKPAFDAMWQAAGWPRCMNYDEKGTRT